MIQQFLSHLRANFIIVDLHTTFGEITEKLHQKWSENIHFQDGRHVHGSVIFSLLICIYNLYIYPYITLIIIIPGPSITHYPYHQTEG